MHVWAMAFDNLDSMVNVLLEDWISDFFSIKRELHINNYNIKQIIITLALNLT